MLSFCCPNLVTVSGKRTKCRLDTMHLYQLSQGNIPLVADGSEVGPKLEHRRARLVTGSRRSDCIMPVLRQLHWLPARQRVDFKVATLVHRSLSGTSPSYLADNCRLRHLQLLDPDYGTFYRYI